MTRGGGGAVTPLEDRVRDAVRAKAAEVPPDAVPPLRLPARRRRLLPLAHGGSERKQAPAARGWAVPAAAGIAVVAILAVLFAVAGAVHRGRSAGPSGLAALPRYYVSLTFTGNGQCCRPGQLFTPTTRAVVRATASGKAVAAVDPPRPYGTFVGVTGAADDRTFILAAQKLAYFPLDTVPATRFFVLRLDPSGGHAQLTQLRIPAVPPGGAFTDFSLSPDGTRLAIVSGTGNDLRLSVANLATGSQRTYRPSGIGTGSTSDLMQNSLSWGSDGRTLAFLYWGASGGGGVRLLDTAAPGSDLLANSRLAVGQSSSATGMAYWIQARLTPDGRAIIANRDRPGSNFSQQLVEFSARTGKVTRVISKITHLWGDDEQVRWMSPDGRVLIVTDAVAAHDHSRAPFADVDAGMVTGGHYTPLPWSGRTFTAAW